MSLSEWKSPENKAEVIFSGTGMKLEINSEDNLGNSKLWKSSGKLKLTGEE